MSFAYVFLCLKGVAEGFVRLFSAKGALYSLSLVIFLYSKCVLYSASFHCPLLLSLR